MHVIGTAGHIDHGKSTLIQALTGIDPDRLQEEKERGMTIDLGFAWITLPSGLEAGIVDVPGHHRFVRNMLAGVGGIDLVLFVIAATESWMPQSQEHLDIINLLGLTRGLVVLTKADLVEEEWLAMVTEEVRGKLAGSTLAQAEILPVSSTVGTNLDLLKQKIDVLLAATPPAADVGRPRLWIDRVFTIRGAGTVVTGTLEGGTLQLDQTAELLPTGQKSRIRGLQTHHKSVEQAEPGARVAVNLTGLQTEDVRRGDALVAPDQWAATDVVNVQLRLLPSLSYELPAQCELKFYVGTAELLAQVRLLDRQVLNPGETALAQMRLERAAAIGFHDRFIVRDATRQGTVGGGIVLDAHAQRVRGTDLRLPRSAPGAYRVLSAERTPVRRLDLTQLEARVTATVNDLPLIMLKERGWVAISEMVVEVPLEKARLMAVLADHAAAGRLIMLPEHVVLPQTWSGLTQRLQDEIAAYHAKFPLRPGLSKETLRSGLNMEPRLFAGVVGLLVATGALQECGAVLRLPAFTPAFSVEQQQEADRIIALLSATPFSPPDLGELLNVHGCNPEVINALIDQERLIKVGKDLVYLDSTLAEAKEKIASTIQGAGSIDVGAVRDLLSTTRKFALPLLEYLDQVGFTRRVGDKRILA